MWQAGRRRRPPCRHDPAGDDVSRGAASRLGRRDFKAILGLLAATRELELDTPYRELPIYRE